MPPQHEQPPASDAQTATCRVCRRPIDAADVYCRHCGKKQTTADSWIYRPIWLIVLTFFVLGILSVPLIVRSPYLSRAMKTVFIVVNVLYTLALVWLLWWLTMLMIDRIMDLQAIGP